MKWIERNLNKYSLRVPFSMPQVVLYGAFRSVDYLSQPMILCTQVHHAPFVDLRLRPCDYLTCFNSLIQRPIWGLHKSI